MAGSLLRRRDVRLIVGSVGISSIGDFLLWVPLTLYLQRTTGSAIAVAGLFLALWSPAVVLAPFAGYLVDRLEARAVLIVASLAQAAIATSLAFALDSTGAILVLAALLGIGFAVAQPAEFSLVPVIGGEAPRLTELNGLVETARYGGATLGPLLGGLLAGLGGTRPAMFVNAASFLVVALAGLGLHARRRVGHAELGHGDRLRDGVVYLFRDRALSLVLSVVIVSLLFMSASISAEVFFVKQDLHVSDFGYGFIFACWTVGMTIGSLVIARRVRASLVVATLIAVGVQGAGLGLPTTWLVVPFGCALWLVGGAGHGTKNVLMRTLIQERVPGRLHGRAFAAYNGLRNGAELIALAAGGLLVAAIGARATLALAGAIPLLAALVGLLVYQARRETVEPAPSSSVPSQPSA
jgi:MFS family permease